MGHLHPIFKPYRGVFIWMPVPTVEHLQLFQNKMTNALGERVVGVGMGLPFMLRVRVIVCVVILLFSRPIV